jgi:hypothetical protein
VLLWSLLMGVVGLTVVVTSEQLGPVQNAQGAGWVALETLTLRSLAALGMVLILTMSPLRRVRAVLLQPRVFLPLLVGGQVVLWGILAWRKQVTVGGTSYWWLFEDAMISMRYAHHLAQGHGLVWNPGEYVEGYSNVLWVLVMAGVHLLPVPLAATSLVMAWITIGLAALLLVQTDRLLVQLGGSPVTRLFGQAGLAGSTVLMRWSVGGSEVILLALLVVGSLSCLLTDRAARRVRPRAFLLLSVLPLVRADGVVLAGVGFLVALALLWGQVPRRHQGYLLGHSLTVGVPFLAHLTWRLAYYGEWLPNTAYLKVFGVPQKILLGLDYLAYHALVFLPLVLVGLTVLIFGIRQERPHTVLWVGVLAYLLYLVGIGGDVFCCRFLIPVFPLALVLAFRVLQRIPRPPVRRGVLLLALISMPVLGTESRLAGHDGPNVVLGVTLATLPPHLVVADAWAGIPPYFSGLRGVDLLGKTDAHVARRPARYGRTIGHNKLDPSYSLGVRRPDLVIIPPAKWLAKASVRRDRAEIWVLGVVANPWFLTHCAPYPLDLDTWRTVYWCDWSATPRLQIVAPDAADLPRLQARKEDGSEVETRSSRWFPALPFL